MSEPTPEQKRKTILLARKISKNICEQQFFPLLKEYAEWKQERIDLMPAALRATFQPPAEPQEDPQEQVALNALLAEIKGEKK
jgi:hypothetical protein